MFPAFCSTTKKCQILLLIRLFVVVHYAVVAGVVASVVVVNQER